MTNLHSNTKSSVTQHKPSLTANTALSMIQHIGNDLATTLRHRASVNGTSSTLAITKDPGRTALKPYTSLGLVCKGRRSTSHHLPLAYIKYPTVLSKQLDPWIGVEVSDILLLHLSHYDWLELFQENSKCYLATQKSSIWSNILYNICASPPMTTSLRLVTPDATHAHTTNKWLVHVHWINGDS